MKNGSTYRYNADYDYMYDEYKLHIKEVLFASQSKIDRYDLKPLQMLLHECITSGYISISIPSADYEYVIEVFSGTGTYSIGHVLFNKYIGQELKKRGWFGYVAPFGLNRSWVSENYETSLSDPKLPITCTFEQFIFDNETLRGFSSNYHCISLDIKYNPSIFYIFDEYSKGYEMQPTFKKYHKTIVYDGKYKYNTLESPFLGYADEDEFYFYSQCKNRYLQRLKDGLEGLPEKYERGVECFGENYPYVLNLKYELAKLNKLKELLLTQY
jgi:hypothetical protein